jgi:hypothetical protein
MTVPWRMSSSAAVLAVCLGLATAGSAAPQDNVCWGKTASALAQRSDDSVAGGGMGAHSRSETAANNVGGFANSSNPFGQDQPRAGVGNVSGSFPHGVAPGDGGNGQHAVNNGQGFSTVIDPVTGEPIPTGDGAPVLDPDSECGQMPVGDDACALVTSLGGTC